jgi:hypothetical protein
VSVIDAVDGSSTRHVSAMNVGAVKRSHDSEELAMQTITTIGLDIAKSVFQVHGVDAGGQVVIRRQLKRRYVLAFFIFLHGRGVSGLPEPGVKNSEASRANRF